MTVGMDRIPMIAANSCSASVLTLACMTCSAWATPPSLEVDQHDRVAKDRRFEIGNGEVFYGHPAHPLAVVGIGQSAAQSDDADPAPGCASANSQKAS